MLFALTSMDALAVMHFSCLFFSCLFEMGNTRVIDAAYGPREVQSKGQQGNNKEAFTVPNALHGCGQRLSREPEHSDTLQTTGDPWGLYMFLCHVFPSPLSTTVIVELAGIAKNGDFWLLNF
ncbi:hypothetical protein GQ55_1G447800 [Panicum hallii var. hallii]|uniref:Secreted protein n=1 Tax=Panicum hallii var. hallii TaxID=1504633 RepID=A0A2T7FE95_9POAL|nr:hypothetical protein GQ55_1G447800 [Panicum hallii var. hallii]